MQPVRSALALAALFFLVVVASASAQGPPVQIDWGTGLGEKAVIYRNDHNISAGRNVTVFEFERNGKLATIAIDSAPYGRKKFRGKKILGHAERRAANILRSYGIEPHQVKRIYTELHPCSLQGRRCDLLLRNTFPGAGVEYSYEYGDTRRSRRAGTKALKQTVNGYYARRNAAQNALHMPGARPPKGALLSLIAPPAPRPGGVDFSSLELRYVSLPGGKPKGAGFSMRGVPSAVPGDPAVGLATAKRASDAFFAWLALPAQSHWVNLGPFESHQIMDPQFARTEAGRILLQADLDMKDHIAPLTHPDTPTGAQFWSEMDALYGEPGSENICVMMRYWIEPMPATVHESDGELYILDAPLRVDMERIDVARVDPMYRCPAEDPAVTTAKEEILKRATLPTLTQLVNTSSQFAELRRVYVSRVAAEWVRARADRNTPLGKLIDSGQIDRWVADPMWNPLDVFNDFRGRYYNPNYYSYQRKVMRPDGEWTFTYTFGGGVTFASTPRQNTSRQDFRARYPRLAKQARQSVRRATADAERGDVWLGARAQRGKATRRNVLEAKRWRRAGGRRQRAGGSRQLRQPRPCAAVAGCASGG
jgi:Xanthomonas XOO_2897-like deaminase